MYEHWVLDASMSRDGVMCWCPIEGDPKGDFSVITGMNLLSSLPPNGRVIAVMHADGDDAVSEWCFEHQDVMHMVQAHNDAVCAHGGK